jgi:TolA-binding protein
MGEPNKSKFSELKLLPDSNLMTRHFRSPVILFLIIFSISLNAQRTTIYSDPDQLYKQGLELYDKKQYASAQKSFTDYYAITRSSLLKADALYYAGACGIELFHKDSEWIMRDYIAKYPAGNQVNNAWYYLGKSNFRKKKYQETLEYFEKVDIYKLDKEQLAELYFKRGYSYLQKGNDEKAKLDFYEIKDVDNKYTFPALYYHSHILYKEKNYDAALEGFNRLVGNETFGSAVPYYITQIYFIQGKYDKVVKEAPKLFSDTSNVQKIPEINRMIGESYFNMRDYKNALVYLKKTSAGNAQGNYAIGYSYYKMNDCAKAVQHLEKATEPRDSLAQNAFYHLADCYLRLNEKTKAKNAYYNAYQVKYDKNINEDALFSFAKLSYELDFNPYNEAVKGFTKYLKEYPQSKRKDEVYNFLINVYSTTKSYDQAIQSIESIQNMDPILKMTYQKLIFFRGVELFNNNDLLNAEKQFKKSLAQNSDPRLNAQNLYWLGEINYLRKDYNTAIDYWKRFQVTEGAVQLDEYELSNYALGYAYFHRKGKDDYSNANISFRKFLMSGNKFDENKIIDARIRTADCYFMNRDFIQASENYRVAIAANKLDVDYSLYQKALCDGLNRNYNEKIAELKKIENNFPKSPYLIASINEIAETYYNNLRDHENAITYYEKILKNYSNSSFANNANAQLGNIYYEKKQDDKAFEYYDRFVKNDSKSEAAKEVLEAIKKIFEAKGNIEEMEKYFASVGNPLSENQIEKSTYTAASDAFYNQKDCDAAMPKWESYFTKFPNGKYITEAKFSYAECAYSKNEFEKALAGYRYVIERPRGMYSEVALTKASYILFKDKNYKEALPLFMQLQDIAETPSNKILGRLGAMRSAFYLADYETALNESVKVLNSEKLTPQQSGEAKYIRAKSMYETNRLDDALTEMKALTKSSKNVTGAEAFYYIARIQYSKQEYKEVEKTINKLISYEYSNDDWNNKGMLLLADAYIALGEVSDAEVILQTIIDSNPKQEFLDEANKKLESVKNKKTEASESAKPDEMKVEFNQSKKDSVMFRKLNEENDKNNKPK